METPDGVSIWVLLLRQVRKARRRARNSENIPLLCKCGIFCHAENHARSEMQCLGADASDPEQNPLPKNLFFGSLIKGELHGIQQKRSDQ